MVEGWPLLFKLSLGVLLEMRPLLEVCVNFLPARFRRAGSVWRGGEERGGRKFRLFGVGRLCLALSAAVQCVRARYSTLMGIDSVKLAFWVFRALPIAKLYTPREQSAGKMKRRSRA